MEIPGKRSTKKKLGELLIEAGIVKPEELPRGLEYAQKASDADMAAVTRAKELIVAQGLSVPTALRALTLAKQKHVDMDQALIEIGWRPRQPAGFGEPTAKPVKSSFNTDDLDAIGVKGHAPPSGGLKAGLKASGLTLKPGATKPLVAPGATAHDNADIPGGGDAQNPSPKSTAFANSADSADLVQAPNAVPYNPLDQFASQGYSYSDLFASDNRSGHAPDHFAESPNATFSAPITELPVESLQTNPPPLPDFAALPEATSDVAAPQIDTIAGLQAGFINATQSGDNYFAEQEYSQAEAAYQSAIDALEQKPGSADLQIADLLVKMGRACLQMSEFNRCERHFTRALKIREGSLGSENIAVAECLDYLAELFDVQSQYLQAEQYYLGALGIKERVLSPSDSELARSLKKLVAVSKHRGNRPEEHLSGELLTEAGIVEMRKLQEGLTLAQEKAMPVGRALIKLSYLTENDLESVLQAQFLLREGAIPGYLAIRALRLSSEQRIDFEQALNEMGLEPGDNASAGAFQLLQLSRQLLQVEKELDPDHHDVACMCMKLGDLYLEHRRFQQAELLYKRAFKIEQRQPEKKDDGLIEVLGRLAELYCRQQRYDEAEQAYLQLLDLSEGKDNDNLPHANVLESLASLHYMRADYKEAGRLYQLVINNKERLLGAEHPGIVSTLQGRANCYFSMGRFAEAEKLYQRAFDVHSKVYGNTNECAISLMSLLGDVYYGKNDFVRAQDAYSKALDWLGECSNPDFYVFLSMLAKAADCLFKNGDLERSEAYYRHYLQTRESAGIASGPEMADLYEKFAGVLHSLTKLEEAAKFRQLAVGIRHETGWVTYS